jgi:hypothetical protein
MKSICGQRCSDTHYTAFDRAKRLSTRNRTAKNVCIYVCDFHHFICFYLQILVERAVLQVNISYYSMQSANRDENKRNFCGMIGAPANE